MDMNGKILFKAARKLPRLRRADGTYPDGSTLWRWWTKGDRRGNRLRAERQGGQVYTTAAWVDEFLDAQNSDPGNPNPSVTILRQRQIAAAENRLAASGI